MDPTNKNKLVITRVFDALVKTVWKYWSEPEYLKKWWGPTDFSCPESKIDFKVGGKYLSCMQASNSEKLPEEMRGQKMWSTGVYREIVQMKKIVATDSFSDENGNIIPASSYGLEGFPMALEVTVTFEELDGKTKMILEHAGIANIGDKSRSDMEQGWNQSLDKLSEAVSK